MRDPGWMGRRRHPRTTAPAPRTGVGPALGRRERLAAILARDGGHCVWCRRGFDDTLIQPTTEHVVPRVKGGPSWIENEVAACSRCNSERGHRTPADYALECRGLGRDPDVGTILAVLRSLEKAIHDVGGQRRARPYVGSQIRRLENLVGD